MTEPVYLIDGPEAGRVIHDFTGGTFCVPVARDPFPANWLSVVPPAPVQLTFDMVYYRIGKFVVRDFSPRGEPLGHQVFRVGICGQQPDAGLVESVLRSITAPVAVTIQAVPQTW